VSISARTSPPPSLFADQADPANSRDLAKMTIALNTEFNGEYPTSLETFGMSFDVKGQLSSLANSHDDLRHRLKRQGPPKN